MGLLLRAEPKGPKFMEGPNDYGYGYRLFIKLYIEALLLIFLSIFVYFRSLKITATTG